MNEGLKGWKCDINQKLYRARNWGAKRSFVEKKIAQPKKKMVSLKNGNSPCTSDEAVGEGIGKRCILIGLFAKRARGWGERSFGGSDDA